MSILDEKNPVAAMTLKPVSLEKEYAKNPEIDVKDIEELQKWAQTKDLPEISDELMILFYHSCKFDKKTTYHCIETYYKLRRSTPEFFKNRDLSRPELQQAVKVLQCSPLPVKDPNGYQIIYHGLQNYEASKYVFNDGVKLLSMTIDSCLMVEGTVPGYVFLFNMKGVKLTHLARLSVTSLRKFFIYLQEGMPVRLKAIHVVNTLPIIDKIMFMIKPFMKKELLSMIHFHYSNKEEVQEFLPKSCLPSDLDGELPSVAELHGIYSMVIVNLMRLMKPKRVVEYASLHSLLPPWLLHKFCGWVSKLTPSFLHEEKWIETENNNKSENETNLRNLCID